MTYFNSCYFMNMDMWNRGIGYIVWLLRISHSEVVNWYRTGEGIDLKIRNFIFITVNCQLTSDKNSQMLYRRLIKPLYCWLQAGTKSTTNSTSTPLTPAANNMHGSTDDVFDDIQVSPMSTFTVPDRSQVMVYGLTRSHPCFYVLASHHCECTHRS